MKKNNKTLIDLCNISIAAGLIVKKFYKKKSIVQYKKDKSPLTEADIASNNFIVDSLYKIDSNIPILTEESLVSWKIRKKWSTYWLVDPLDGTKEFIKQNDQFTINIALIEKNEPVIGIIYAPALKILYYASKNKGSFKISTSKKIISLKKSILLKSIEKKKSDKLNVISSKSHSKIESLNWLKTNIKNYNIIKVGSSLKFCKIAEGAADLYPRLGPTSEWDIAAGHIILNEAGGRIEGINREKILYNKKESVINPSFVAYGNLSK